MRVFAINEGEASGKYGRQDTWVCLLTVEY